jgi:hypothetical protein
MLVELAGVINYFMEPIFCFGLHKINSGVWGLHKAAPLVTEKKERFKRDLKES